MIKHVQPMVDERWKIWQRLGTFLLKVRQESFNQNSRIAQLSVVDFCRGAVMQIFKAKDQSRVIRAYDVCDFNECNDLNYEVFARDGFSKNVVVYRSISLISKALASVELNITGDPRSNWVRKKIHAFLNNAGGKHSFVRSLEPIVSYLLISGNAYIYINNGINMSAQVLRPDRVEIIPSNDNTSVDYYVYRAGDKTFKIKDVHNLIHLKFFNPLNDWYGLSPLHAAAQSVDQHNSVSCHNLSLLRNGGRPSGCLVLNADKSFTDIQREQLKTGLRDAYSGANNAGKMMILEGDFEWKELGKTPKDLDFFTGKNISAREIAQAYGIPPMLIGIQGDSSFANYREARFHLWEDTILPLASYIFGELNRWIHENIDQNLSISMNLDKIPALSFKRDMLWKRMSECDFLTVEEKREFLGLPPLKEC